jgi:hypothetical protein
VLHASERRFRAREETFAQRAGTFACISRSAQRRSRAYSGGVRHHWTKHGHNFAGGLSTKYCDKKLQVIDSRVGAGGLGGGSPPAYVRGVWGAAQKQVGERDFAREGHH